MAYSTDIADVLAAQLERFVTLNRHQLVGQAANLDFWLAEVGHCFDVIDRYGERFARLDTAQRTSAAEAPAPKRVPEHALRKARRALAGAAFRFLARCRDELILSPGAFRAGCVRIGLDPDSGWDTRPGAGAPGSHAAPIGCPVGVIGPSADRGSSTAARVFSRTYF